MRGNPLPARLSCIVALAIASSGCTLNRLKEANQRLRESNDRLVSEINRLEAELAAQSDEAPPVAPREPVETPELARDEPASDLPDDIYRMPEAESVKESPVGVHYRFDQRVFFGLGQAKLSSSGQRVLDRMGNIIRDRYPGRMIRVEGHTDDIPVKKVRHLYPSNWELSTARACTVVRYLIEQARVSPDRIYPVGFAFYRPAVDGSSSAARQKNRRVEITILNGTPSVAGR